MADHDREEPNAPDAEPRSGSWREAFDRCRNAYYAGDFGTGAAACDDVLASPDVPPEYAVHARRNLTWYARELGALQTHATVRFIPADPPGRWTVREASIAERPDGEGFVLLARCDAVEAGGAASRLALIGLDHDLARAGELRWLDCAPAPERVFVFRSGSAIAVAGVVPGASPDGEHSSDEPRSREIACWTIDPGSISLNEFWRTVPEPRTDEAWAPVEGIDGPALVCRIAPTVVLRVDAGDRRLRPEAAAGAPALARELRTASPFLRYGNGWLSVVCQWAIWEDGRRAAMHRLARFNESWRLTHLSGPMLFPGLEDGVASGLVRRDRAFLLSGPAGAEGCWVAEIPDAAIASLLRPAGKCDDLELEPEHLPPSALSAWLDALPRTDDQRIWIDRAVRLLNAGAHESAVSAFKEVVELPGDDLLAGKAAYDAAMILSRDLGRWGEAADIAARGVGRNPEMPELYWIAGYASYWAGRPDRAARWARAAIGINAQIDAGLIPPRRELAHLSARIEGPWDVLQHALKQLGDQDGADWAEFRHRIAAQRNAYAHPPVGKSIARDPDRTLIMPSRTGLSVHAGGPVPRVVYCCWTGDNPITPQRERALQTIRDSAGVQVVLVTPENLADFIVEPLHPAYSLLSLTHRSDYLRAYLMHHHGGGYTDLKFQSFDWTPYFDLLDAAPEAYFCGCREPASAFIPHREPFNRMPESFLELCGQIHFLFRPLTIFTSEWMDMVHRALDRHFDELRRHPGHYHPRAIPGGVNEDDTGGAHDGSRYPVRWNELLADPLLELMYRHRGEYLPEMPFPNRYRYR